jgi:hypothetical protein
MSDPRKVSAAQFLAAFTLLPLTWLLAGPSVVIAMSSPVLLYLLSVAVRALVRERDWGTVVLASPGLLGLGWLLWSAQHAEGASGVAAILAATVILALQARLGFVLTFYDLQRMRIGLDADQQDIGR